MSTSTDSTVLREPWRTLWRRKFLILLTAGIVAVAALAAAMVQAPRYDAAADILIETPETPVTELLSFSSSGATTVDPVRALQTEIQLVRSKAVRDSVSSALGVDVAPEIVAEAVGQSNLIRIIGRAGNADQAAAIVSAYAESYIQFRAGAATAGAVQALSAEITEIDQQINAFDQRINSEPPDPNGDSLAKRASVREALISEYVTLSTRLRQTRVEAAARAGRASVVVPAQVPTSPTSPKPLMATALGLAWGGLLGIAMAFIIEGVSGRRRLGHHALMDDAQSTDGASRPHRRRRRRAENGSEAGEVDRDHVLPPDGETE